MAADTTFQHRISWLTLPMAMIACSAMASGDMEALSESEMADVEGQGVGIVLEDFKFAHGTNESEGTLFRLSGIQTSDGEDVEVTVDRFYIGGADSDYGQNLGNVNLGRLTNPYTIQLRDGDELGDNDLLPDARQGKAVFEFAAPTKDGDSSCIRGGGGGTCSSRDGERFDMGLQTTIDAGGESSNLNVHATAAVIDGSYIRLWGDDERNQLAGEIQMNFYTPELAINACDQSGSNCGDTIFFNDFLMELSLGNELQPLFFSVLGPNQTDLGEPGNLRLEIQDITEVLNPDLIGDDGSRGSSDGQEWDRFEAYYTNPDYRSNIEIGQLQVGDQDFGSSRMEGVLFQKLEMTTRALPQ